MYSPMNQTGAGRSSDALEKSLDKVLDLRVLFTPGEDGGFLEDIFFWGSQKNPLESSVPQFRVFLSVKEDGENLFLENLRVLLEKSGKAGHGSRSDGSLLVFVQKYGQKFFGRWDQVDVAESDNSLGLFIERSLS
jgi:hypothetical protein